MFILPELVNKVNVQLICFVGYKRQVQLPLHNARCTRAVFDRGVAAMSLFNKTTNKETSNNGALSLIRGKYVIVHLCSETFV